jgi:uncharacterized protein YdeI (YjbR/CyaY-like superfamily)
MSRKTFHISDRNEWRKWLGAHFESEDEIWLIFPLKASGEESIVYNDAVEEALCFGWIDSTTGRLDDLHGIRRFSPRREGSSYSRANIERLIWLDKQDMIHPKVRETVIDIIKAPYEFPEDIIEVIQKDTAAWEHYQTLSDSYKRIRIAYIDAARNRPQEFKKRLDSFIRKTREQRLIVGFGGIDKYYT